MQTIKNMTKEIFISVASFLLLLLFLNTYVVSVTKVSGESMFPTFTTDDQILFSKLSTYSPLSYQRGDIVVCRFGKQGGMTEYAQDNTATYIKRIIAIEGDIVEIMDGKIFVNDEDVTLHYWGDVEIEDSLLRLKIPKGHVFVVGDNVNNSIDSRIVSSIPYSNILGKVIYKIEYKNIFGENVNIKIPSFIKMF
jgi:signal peptidase I